MNGDVGRVGESGCIVPPSSLKVCRLETRISTLAFWGMRKCLLKLSLYSQWSQKSYIETPKIFDKRGINFVRSVCF